MSKKVSQPGLGKPTLAAFYEAANKRSFGTSCYIRPELYPKFSVFEDDLRAIGIAPRDYAYTVVESLKKWATSKGMRFVPVHTFCSDFALEKARRILESRTVKIEPGINDNGQLLHSELLVARAYIAMNTSNGDVVRLGSVVEQIGAMLDEAWLDAYNKGKKRPIGEVLDILSDEYGIRRAVSNYADIVSILRHGSKLPI